MQNPMSLQKFPFFSSIFLFAIAAVIGTIQIASRLACETSNSGCINAAPVPEILALFGLVLLTLSFVPEKTKNSPKVEEKHDLEIM
jgi:hypothetical protein